VKPYLCPRTAFTLFLFLLVSAQAAPDWRQLREGMTMAEAVKFLGEPLLRCHARGLERWIYDGAGEVIFYGGVRAWTVPSPSPESTARPVESDVLFRKAGASRAFAPPAATPPPASERGNAEGMHFRYR